MAEVEAKFALTPDQATALVRKLGHPTTAIQQWDTYFNTPQGHSLRIRREIIGVGSNEERRAFLTYKSVNLDSTDASGIRAVTEIEPPIPFCDADKWTSVFSHLGFTPDVTVIKKRQEYEIMHMTNAKICIDQVNQLGYFAEVEIISDFPEAAKRNLQRLIESFGLSDMPKPNGSYRYLLNQALGRV